MSLPKWIKDELECGHDYRRLWGVLWKPTRFCRHCAKDVDVWSIEPRDLQILMD